MARLRAKKQSKKYNLDGSNGGISVSTQYVDNNILTNNSREETTTPAEETTAPAEEITAPAEEITAPAEEITAPAEETTTPVEEITTPVEEITTPVEEITTPVEEITTPVEETTTPAEETTTPAEETTTPAEETTTPAEETTTPEVNIRRTGSIKRPSKSSNPNTKVSETGGGIYISTPIEKKTYPIITSSSFEEPYTAVNNEKIANNNYNAIVTTAVVIASSLATLYYSCANQLGIALGFTQAKGNAQLVQRIMNQNILTFLSMNEEGLAAISGVGNRIDSLMNFYNPFISNAIVAEKSFNTVTDFGKLLHKPNADNIIKLAVDFIDTVGTYYESPYTAIFPISNAGYLAYQGEYMPAGEQIIMATSYALPLIMNTANPAALAVMASIGIATTYNFYTTLNDYKNDAEDIDSITSYKELYKIIPESIFNTTEKMQEFDASIHHNNKIIEKDNLKKFIETQGDFGAKLAKHIYLPIIEEKYELLNQVSQRKITQEEADQLQTKHFVIELENRLYDHCIEVKNEFYDPNKDYYHCYILDKEILDRVIIGQNNTVEKVELEA
jgi:hypothetical protein